MAEEKETEHRLTKLEVLVEKLVDNEIPHIQADMKSMKHQNAWIIRGVILMLLGIIADILIR